MSLLSFNRLPEAEKRRRCIDLVPVGLVDHVLSLGLCPTVIAGGDPRSYEDEAERIRTFAQEPAALRLIGLPNRGELQLRVPAARFKGDYALGIDLADVGGGQIELAFIVINDLASPRFDIDRHNGMPTLLGTASRNIEAEVAAMRAGLGPCQVRRGLRLLGELVPGLERFARALGYVSLQLRPLTYHVALSYERCGFGYLDGHRRMLQIDREFARGGALARALDGSTPFRRPEQAHTARGRSWAIHDGILEALDGKDWLELQMFKVFGREEGIRTAPGLIDARPARTE
ncbi:MAG: hypothetical protein JJU36_00325 [Phycisphaeraceae bacterium]|nr:hypothetical protein [Phycisphaeraceae bacterium]